MKIYHYSSFSKIGAILGKNRTETPGLVGKKGVDLLFPQLENPKASFGLLEPTPSNWVQNKDHPNTWNILTDQLKARGDGSPLVEIDVKPEDEVYVGDRAILERLLETFEGDLGSLFNGELSEEVKKFKDSLVPLGEYIREDREYSLPEVLILNTIPPERIRVSDHQPLLEEELRALRGEGRDYLVHLISHGFAHKELMPWRQAYKSTHGPLEGIQEGIETH